MSDSDLSYELARWYEGPAGQRMRQHINAQLPKIVASMSGQQHAQIGVGNWPGMYKKCMQLSYHDVFGAEVNPGVLPNSMDSLLLIHALDVNSDPQRILHIADKLVAKSGHLIIVGFNPFSLWGLMRLPMLPMRRSPWRSGFYSLWRIRDWLKVLNYEVRLQTSLVQLPPLPAGIELNWMDKILHWLMPNWGAVNIIVAKRPWFPMTGVKSNKIKERLEGVVMPEPSTRNIKDKV